MKNISDVNEQITELVKARYQKPGSFEDFTAGLRELGVIRQTYDVIKNDLEFYSKTQLLLRLPLTDIEQTKAIYPLKIGDALCVSSLEKALSAFDDGKTSASQFHKDVASAGVVYVSLSLTSRKIVYVGQDAESYLEVY